MIDADSPIHEGSRGLPPMNTEKNSPERNHKKVVAANYRIKHLTEQLSLEDLRLGLPLLDAAVAGVVLGFKPSDREMREQAERCWETLKPILNHHLFSEDERVLPWAKGMAGFSPAVMLRLKRRHDELRRIAKQLARVSFEEDTDRSVARAGKGLCMLAVKLDDLIASEELRLLPALRKLLFSETGIAAAAETVQS
jgi:hemerythrin HHE cation binding domain-containing protein